MDSMDNQDDGISIRDEYLCTDIKTLRNLLTVNRFFFHAILPRLFGDGDPLVVWDMNYVSSKYETNRDKLFAVAFVSFMQARLDESQCDPEDDQQVDRILSGILKQYGLKMTTSFKPFLPSGLDMVEKIFWHTRNAYSKEFKEFRRNTAQRMTVDYSKLMTVLWMDEWRFFPPGSMIRLCKLPDDLRRREAISSPSDALSETHDEEPSGIVLTTIATADIPEKPEEDHSDDSDKDDDEELVLEYQHDSRYTWELRYALREMWIHYNCDCITSFVFEMAKAHKYLPLSAKMAKLQVIHIRRLDAMPDSHLENTILFIKQNLTAFPEKRQLNIEFDGTWYLLDEDEEDNITDHSLTDLNTYNAGRRNYRERCSRFMQPAIKIYEALGRPEQMQASYIPKFYDLTKHIDLDRLRSFSDEDLERIDQGERAGMEAFLRRCDDLKELNLGVGNHDVLSWAAADTRITTSPPFRRALKNLETLELRTSRSYNFVIHALSDAVDAFSTSLRKIQVKFRNDFDDQIPYPLRNAQTMESLRLQRLAPATTIGDWSVLLPNLRIFKINLKGVASINVGSFDQCPNLSILEIRFGCLDSDECRPRGSAPLSIPEHEPLSLKWRQPEIDCTLFPKWSLPNLKQLKLYDLAAMRFNLTSLTTMARLQTLIIEIDPRLCCGQDLDIRSHRLNIPMLQPTATPDSRSWRRCYLPELKEISLKGPHSALIDLDCLRSLPRLESIRLNNFGGKQEMRRHITDGFDSIFCPTDSQAEGENTDYSPQSNGARSVDNDTPFLESRLRKFKLEGDWLMSGQVATSLLTTYAPLLERLSVYGLTNGTRDGYTFLEAIHNADKINKAYEVAARSTSKDYISSRPPDMKNNQRGSLPGRNLITAKCRYSVSKEDMRSLGLREIMYGERTKYKKNGVRMYSLLDRHVIRQEDYDSLDEKTRQESDSSE
ncbi:hypothetical protein BGZ80_000462 [Entomortierella chlamydospora]|uniref:Uncharacterized protein n=1 Tax=Entomortierella chlamydospora TaxID=101097 RepID=A0A9P6SYF0_9FUNG|nr:hypothetical protein BGZ80_000462 [Entomortierella chlamydospora]